MKTFYKCRNCGHEIPEDRYKKLGQVIAGYPARCSCSPLTDFARWEKLTKQTTDQDRIS